MRVYLVNLDITVQEKTAGFSCSHNALKKSFYNKEYVKHVNTRKCRAFWFLMVLKCLFYFFVYLLLLLFSELSFFYFPYFQVLRNVSQKYFNSIHSTVTLSDRTVFNINSKKKQNSPLIFWGGPKFFFFQQPTSLLKNLSAWYLN